MSSLAWRVNPVTILSAAITIVGLFLPWWGVDITGGGINRIRLLWNVWNPPHFNGRVAGATTLYWNFALSSVSVLVLALIAASLVIVGSLTLIRKYLVAGLILSGLSLVVYSAAVDYVTRNYCLTPLCVQGPIGIVSVPGVDATWGFQSGFYVTLLAILVLAAGLLLNSLLVRGKPTILSKTLP